MRLPTFKELRRFVDVEGWEDKDAKSNKSKGDHHRYVFTTPTGERLYTRISHGRDEIQNPNLFVAILKDQLCIDEAQFWDAVDNGVKPKRPMLNASEERSGMDASLARNLIKKVGMSSKDLVGLSQEGGVKIWQDWLSRGGEYLSGSE